MDNTELKVEKVEKVETKNEEKVEKIEKKKCGRPKKENCMVDNLTFKLSSEDKFYYMRLAKSSGKNISDFIRSAMYKVHGNSSDLNL